MSILRKILLVLFLSRYGLVEAKSMAAVPDSMAQRDSIFRVVNLDDVTVKGKAHLASLTDDGFVYRMAGNKRAQDENMLQALNYVPLVNVDVNGDIKVQGSSSYSLYLNGRPYDMAQTSPKVFLESLPASSISKVEVITKPSNKYAPTGNRFIINIVLKSHFVDGYVVGIGAGGNTQPSANGNVLGMIKKENVETSVTYDYRLNGQRNQPTDIAYSKPDADDSGVQEWNARSRGDGNWQTHTMRAMLKWNIDSLNTVYADAHARISRMDMTGSWEETSPASPDVSHFSNINDYTAGTLEANVTYRNYSAKFKNVEQMTIGYHFTYNPDKRDFTQRYEDGNTLQYTDGGMTEHSALVSRIWMISPRHGIRFLIKDIYRHGHTNSLSVMSFDGSEDRYSMNYRNNIVVGKISYSGAIGRLRLNASLTANEDLFRMRLPQDALSNYSNNHFYLMPAVSVYRMLDKRNTLSFSYSTSVTRPTIQMLNPYANVNNGYSISRGNPLLKSQYSHDVSLDWYYNGANNLSLFLAAGYVHCSDIIQSYMYHSADGKVVSSYGNLGRSNEVSMMWNAQWNGLSWLILSADGKVGRRHLSAASIGLNQNDWFYNITPRFDLLLPDHYRLGGSLGIYRNLPNPWAIQNTLSMYSFYASKSFLKGRLNISLMANSPFSKYHKSIVDTRLPDIRTVQTNYITARSFGINVSYSFGSGKKVDLRRDKVMQSTDQTTGVN